MSLLTMASVAVARDLTEPGEPLAKDVILSKVGVDKLGAGAAQPPSGWQAAADPADQAAGRSVGASEAQADGVGSFGQLLVAQIPSEALLAYITLLALFSVAGASYNTGRWVLYAAAIVVSAVAVLVSYLAQRRYGFDDTQHVSTSGIGSPPPGGDVPDPAQINALGKLHLPYLPVLAAALSMAVYGLTVPGSPLQFEVSGTAFAICSVCMAVGGGVMMSTFAPFLGKGNGAIAVPKQQDGASLPGSSA